MNLKRTFKTVLMGLSIVLLGFLVSCCSDEPTPQPNPVTNKYAPTAPTLKTPEDKATLSSGKDVKLMWDASTDKDKDAVKYTVYLSAKDKEDLTAVKSDITATYYTLNTTLEEGTYRWKVEASDGKHTTASSVFSFVVKAPIPDLALSTNSVSVNAGESTTVTVTAGSGNYTVSSNNEAVASATLNGTTITINGKAQGTAIITATDTPTGKTAEIAVTVKQTATLTIQDKTHYIASLHVGSTTLQGKLTNGLQIKLPYSNGQGSYAAVTAEQTTASGQGGDTKTLRLSLPAGHLSSEGELVATLSVNGNGTYLVRQMPAGESYTIATFALNIGGTPVTLTLKGTGGVLDKLYNVQTNGAYEHQFVYIPITGPDGKTWLNNNLGADYANVNSPVFNPAQQAQAKDDYHAYGSLYQWGREGDGHELINWSSATQGTPKHDNFKRDWSATTYNEPCPNGYHTPTHSEWVALHKAVTGEEGDVNSDKIWKEKVLNLPTAGYRYWRGTFYDQSSDGSYWSSDVNDSDGRNAWYLNFLSGDSSPSSNDGQAYGFSVRCLKD